MDKPNLDLPKLTKNEQNVLKKIIEQAKIPDIEIAKKMGLSQQAIFRIRHKLENGGIIKGYAPIIDYKKIGIDAFVVLGVKFTRYIWNRYSEEQITEKILNLTHVIAAYRIPESKISHLLIMAFKDVDEKDRYLMRLQSRYAKEIEMLHVYPFSADRIIKSNHIGLLNAILSSKASPSSGFFLDK